MTSDPLKRFIVEARGFEATAAPFLSDTLLGKLRAFRWIFEDDAAPPEILQLGTRMREFVWLLDAAYETAMATHGKLPTLIDARNALPGLIGYANAVAPGAADADADTHRVPRPEYDPARAPTFIVSSWRSGSTLLSNIVATHPEIAVLPEVPLLDPFVRSQSLGADLDLAGVAKMPPIVKAQVAARAALGLGVDEFNAAFANFIIEMCSRYASRKGKRRFVLKEVTNHASLDFIDFLFGYHGRFIWLIRHGLDVVASHLSRYGMRGYPGVLTLARDWVSVNEHCANLHDLIGDRGLMIRYEDLAKAPRVIAQQVFDFLGERSDESVLSQIENWSSDIMTGDHKIHSSGGRVRPLASSQWVGWPLPLLNQLAPIVNPMLERAGYPSLVVSVTTM